MSFQSIYLLILFLFINSDIALSQVEIVGDQNFTIVQNDDSINIPFFSNENIHNSNESINRAVIVIHGMNRNADDYYNSIYSIAANNGLLSETIIIAPQFLITLDLNYWELDSSIVFWSGTTPWLSGGQSNSTSNHPRDYEISSFTIMDSLISHILYVFPNLQDITLVGNSAGGQYVNRYAAGSGQNAQGKIDYIISAPSSYLYFDENRYTEYQFPLFWGIPEDCGGYNEYKYGLENLNDYMSIMGTDSIRQRYSRRKIKYLIGTNDTGGTQDCQSMVQGSNRFERAIIYFNYIQNYFGSQITDNHKLALVSEIGHNYDGIFSSECGENAIFNIDGCEQFTEFIYPESNFTVNENSGEYPLLISFTDQSVSGTHPISQLIWGIDSELIYSNGNMDYLFSYPGVFDISMTAIDLVGFSDTVYFESLVSIDTLYGDIDWDNEITNNDVYMILNHSIEGDNLSVLKQQTGDGSGNQNLTPFDASLILQFLGGNLNTLPIIDSENFPALGNLQTPVVSGSEGEIITIPVNLVNADNVFSFSVSLEIDSSRIGSVSIYDNAIADLGFVVEYNYNEEGFLIISGASANALHGDVQLFDLYVIINQFNDGGITIDSDELLLNETVITQDYSIEINQTLATHDYILPTKISLGNNFPNPFNSNTYIKYALDQDENIRISITDLQGRLIKVLFDGPQSRGEKFIRWDGTNASGISARSGIYFCTLETQYKKIAKKMLFLQ